MWISPPVLVVKDNTPKIITAIRSDPALDRTTVALLALATFERSIVSFSAPENAARKLTKKTRDKAGIKRRAEAEAEAEAEAAQN